jgi:hypothetical protein
MAKPAREFEPIVKADVWEANYNKLKQVGRGIGTRGRSKCSNPNSYPLEVICGDCGKPMSGASYQGGRRYVCSTYKLTQGKECEHNWVWRNDVVWYAVHGIRAELEKAKGRKKLTATIQSIIESQQILREGGRKEIEKLKVKLDMAKAEFQRVLDMKISAKDDLERDALEEAYQKRLAEVRKIDKSLKSLQEAESIKLLDKDKEFEATLATINHLHLFLGKISDNRLKETFWELGARMTVWFEKVPYGKNRTKTVPVRGEIALGKDGELLLPAGVDAVKKPKTARKASKAITQGRGKKKRAAGSESSGTLPIDGRGDWI